MSGISDSAVERAWRAAGAEVRRLRNDRGWSLIELGEEVHYSKGYLSKIENGQQRITPEMARRFDKVFGTGSVLATLLAAQEEHTPTQDEPEFLGVGPCPYPGLAAFGPEQARWFFGRTEVITDLVCRLDKHWDECGPLMVVAPSGAGKSSLLAAGLIPALADEALPGSSDWQVVCATPGAHPLSTLAERIAAVTGAHPAAAAAVAGDPYRFAAFLTEAVADGKTGETPSSARVVLIVDQFEEIFTECQQEAERQAFIAALCTAARSAVVVVVLGVRADFYGSCLAYPALLPALQAPVALGPMSAEQIRSIITGPAEAEGLQVEPGLVELLLRDLGVTDDLGVEADSYSPGALPLLAHALRVTCQQGEGRALTVAGYRHTGGIRQALVSTADRAYSRLSPAEQQVTQQLLLRLVNLSDQGKATRRRLTRTQLIEALSLPAHTVEKVLEVLGQARLVTFDAENPGRDGDNVEITHEALLTAWPQLTEWINADRDGLRTHQRLSEAAEEWQATNRDPSGLYRGTRLAIAREWTTGPGCKDRLSALEDAFLSASIDQKHREQHAEQRRTRRLSTLVGVLGVFLVVTLLSGVIAFQQYQRASATELVIEANSLVATRPEAAMLSAVEAYHLAKVLQTRSALLSAQSQHFVGALIDHTETVRAVAFSPDGRILATASDDHTVRLWDVASRHQITVLDGLGPISDAEFSPDGRTLATASADQTVHLWDVTDPAHLTSLGHPLTGAPGTTLRTATFSNAATFSHDGRILATADKDGATRLWDAVSRRQLATLTGQTGPITKVVFSPDDRILATTSADRTAQLWDVASRRQLATLPGQTGLITVKVVVFSPDGHTLATTNDDGTVRLWNITDPAHPTSLEPPLITGYTNAVNAVVFSPDGHTLVTGSSGGTARLWDVVSRRLVSTLGGHDGSIRGVAFSPDGHTVATAGDDHIVKLWDTVGGPILISSPPTISYDVVFSPDGRMLATASDDGTVRLWDMASHYLIATLTVDTGSIRAVVFSPDGRMLATASDDGTVRLWDMASHYLIATLTVDTGSIKAVVFSPDGRTLATASNGGTVRLWNITDPAHPTHLNPLLTGHTDPVVFSPDGRTLATASDDGTVRLWDMASQRQITTLTGSTQTGHTLLHTGTFSSDGHILATASTDGTVWLWDVASHHQIRTLPHRAGGIRSVAFSPKGRMLATANDKTVYLWDISDPYHPQDLAVLTGHTRDIYRVAFSPDGKMLATASNDFTVRLWDLNPDHVTARLCHIIGTVNPEQWPRLYPPELPYQSTCP